MSTFSIVLICIGIFFMVSAGLGLLKFPDLYTRLHAASKASTFGICFIILGAVAMAHEPSDVAKGVLAILFQFISSPIGAHMIARVALKKGVRPLESPAGNLMEKAPLPPEASQGADI